MRELIALDIPASNHLVDIINSIWENGDAFSPIDQRLPAKSKKALINLLKPSRLIDSTGETTKLDGAVPIEADQRLAIATSGTTGTPKIVMYTMDQLIASANATATRIGVTSSDKWLCCLPIAHIGGLSVILRSLLHGNPVEVHNGFDASRVVEAARRGATLTSLVPAALALIDPYSFRKIVLGGSKPPRQLPTNTMVTYGLTETGSGVVYDGVPLPGLKIMISSQSEILLKGPMIATCYRDGNAIQDDLGWLHTRDSGSFTSNKLEVFGRIDEIINSGGEKVYPAVVESLLESHPKVHQIAVIALSDSRWGEAVTAVVVPSPEFDPPTLAELREFVKSELPPYFAPTRLEIVKDMPTTNLGKIQKNVLKRILS